MNCPKCNEFILGNPTKCYKCGANLLSDEQLAAIEKKNKEQQEIEEQNKIKQQQKAEELKELERQRIIEMQHMKQIQEKKQTLINKNPLYEYDTVKIYDDNNTGDYDFYRLQNIINEHAEKRWRLVFVFTNEIGKQMLSAGVMGVSSGSNATIESVTLIFERIIDTGINEISD